VHQLGRVFEDRLDQRGQHSERLQALSGGSHGLLDDVVDGLRRRHLTESACGLAQEAGGLHWQYVDDIELRGIAAD